MSRRNLYQARGPVTLLAIEFDVTEAIAQDATNYWTLQARLVRAGQTIGENVGTPVTTDTRSVSANTRISLYDEPGGLDLADGDVLAVLGTKTGTPDPLQGCVVWFRPVRGTR